MKKINISIEEVSYVFDTVSQLYQQLFCIGIPTCNPVVNDRSLSDQRVLDMVNDLKLPNGVNKFMDPVVVSRYQSIYIGKSLSMKVVIADYSAEMDLYPAVYHKQPIMNGCDTGVIIIIPRTEIGINKIAKDASLTRRTMNAVRYIIQSMIEAIHSMSDHETGCDFKSDPVITTIEVLSKLLTDIIIFSQPENKGLDENSMLSSLYMQPVIREVLNDIKYEKPECIFRFRKARHIVIDYEFLSMVNVSHESIKLDNKRKQYFYDLLWHIS